MTLITYRNRAELPIFLQVIGVAPNSFILPPSLWIPTIVVLSYVGIVDVVNFIPELTSVSASSDIDCSRIAYSRRVAFLTFTIVMRIN